MINELDRLLTITDLSEMLGVPVGTLYGGGTGVMARQATESVVTFDTGGQPSRLGWTLKPTGARGNVAHIERHRRALVLVGAYAGLRWGEAAGLRRRDIDPMRSRIRITSPLSSCEAG
jgi:integrase